MSILDEARGYRRVIETAVQAGLDDETSLNYPTLFPNWNGDGVLYSGPDGAQSKVRYEETLYKCITTHTSQPGWNPKDAASLWARMDDPAEEWPEWVQPIGAADSYSAGAKVSHNGKHWVNTHGDNNVWEPGVYGWEEVV